MAREMRSGTGEGPGICKKCRPLGCASSCIVILNRKQKAHFYRKITTMNAPLSSLAQVNPDQAYEHVSRVTHEVAGELARRLRQHTQGDVRFDLADRGRYATDASIYQVMPVGVFVPRHVDEVGVALDICRELDVPIVARGGGTSQVNRVQI